MISNLLSFGDVSEPFEAKQMIGILDLHHCLGKSPI